jgi:predicted Zn-dependent peptidase
MRHDPTLSEHELERHTLPNGLRLVLVRQPHLHRGTISAYVGAGSRFEAPADNGLSHFLEHMVFRGTERYPTAFELNVATEQLGGTLVASTAPDATALSVSLPRASMARGVEIVAEVLTRPRLGDLEVERRILVEELREDLDEHGRIVDIDFLTRRRLWPGHPLGQSVTGPIENVRRFGAGDLRRWLAERYCARNTVVCVAGAFDGDEIADATARAFAAMRSGSAAALGASPAAPRGASAEHVDKPGSQTAIRLAVLAPGLADPELASAELFLRLLDDGMSTPLHRRIFEDRGLAYNVAADLETYAETGALTIDAVCSHENVVAVAEEAIAILRDLREREVEEDELEKAKRRAVWGLERHLDEPEAMSAWYGEQELVARSRRLAEEAEALSALAAADVRRTAARIVGGALQITTVGVLGERQRQVLSRLAAGGA